jgi:predicted nuclease of predicted toxin-antitoxin system
MKFFFDHNLSPHLANGMKAFGEDTEHLTERFKQNTDDVEWLQYVGDNQMVLITRDLQIRRNPAEIEAIKRHKVRAFFLGGKNLSACRIIQQVVRNWPRIKEYAEKERPPYALRIPPTGTSFEKIQL